jgi:long-subunit fatty acid transport protein
MTSSPLNELLRAAAYHRRYGLHGDLWKWNWAVVKRFVLSLGLRPIVAARLAMRAPALRHREGPTSNAPNRPTRTHKVRTPVAHQTGMGWRYGTAWSVRKLLLKWRSTGAYPCEAFSLPQGRVEPVACPATRDSGVSGTFVTTPYRLQVPATAGWHIVTSAVPGTSKAGDLCQRNAPRPANVG